MTLSDGRTTTVRLGDVVHLKDDQQYRVLKIIATSGSNVLKCNNGSNYRSFLRIPAHVLFKAPQMATQSTHNDPPPSATDGPLAHDILQCCSSAAVEAYRQSHPFCMGNIDWITLSKHIQGDQHLFVGHELQKGRDCDNDKYERLKNKEVLNNVKLKHELKHDIA